MAKYDYFAHDDIVVKNMHKLRDKPKYFITVSLNFVQPQFSLTHICK